ncbi:NmrA-like domain-containing protein 1 [Ceratobasidium sp. 370]|nr:NmrA-like domain-containing protein 1 [Ceratobasidium sp. 370]
MWMFFPLKKNPDGGYVLDWFFPNDARIPSFAAEDYGAWFMAALINPEAWIGKQMHLCVQKLTPRDYASILSKVSGKQVTIKDVSVGDFDALRPHVPDDLWLKDSKLTNLFFLEVFSNKPAMLDDAVEPTRRINPAAQNLEQFVEKHAEQIFGAAVST